MEDKLTKLAKTIVNYSINVQKGEKVLITYQTTEPSDLVKLLIKEINYAGGIPYVNMTDPVVGNLLMESTSTERIKLIKSYQEFEVNNFDAFISIRYRVNDYEGKNIDKDISSLVGKALIKVQDIRINKRKWVLLNYPSSLDAYKASMKIDEFKEFAYDVMTIDYDKMNKEIEPLKRLMEKTDKVRIVSPGTDLIFSIKGMPAIACTGDKNIPDGELYTAPVLNSVNGIITYNTPCPYGGMIFHNVKLRFIDGKIVEATSDEKNERLNSIFDTDIGSRYIGEFSLGFNPKILHPMGDILYDEKILGSLHFTPGRAYKDCYNGNDSSIHWDMVLIQRKEYGGGEIYFDDVLIRKDGLFILPELKALNYDYKEE
ncbi:MAG: aminopeptidase [Bacilli bacterium]